MFLGIVVELDGGGAVIMRINIDADVVADNMVCLFDTLVEVLDIQRFALMIGEEGVDVDRTGAAGNLTDFAFDDGQFQDAFRRGFKFDLRVRIALSDIFGNDVPVQLVDVVLIDAFWELGFNLFGIDECNAGKFDTRVIQTFGIVFRRPVVIFQMIFEEKEAYRV